jgi:hypothetical protein
MQKKTAAAAIGGRLPALKKQSGNSGLWRNASVAVMPAGSCGIPANIVFARAKG